LISILMRFMKRLLYKRRREAVADVPWRSPDLGLEY